MRYENWDILLFPQNEHVPLKEFKTACYVVPDFEPGQALQSPGLPTVTTFVPSLLQGTAFNISIHSWGAPGVSEATKAYSSHHDLVDFEFRVFIDGRIVASSIFSRNTTWPVIIQQSCNFTKHGDLEPLWFPGFREEILYQDSWDPSDNLGRIKVMISEGFPRDSSTMPLERIKNVVCFSFQHAPLEILESSSIAWPNTSMWYGSPASHVPISACYPDHGPEPQTHHGHRQTRCSQSANSGSAPVTNIPLSADSSNHNFGQPQGPALENEVLMSAASMTPQDIEMCERARAARRLAVRRDFSKDSSDLSLPDYASSHHSGPPYLFPKAPNVPPGFTKPNQAQERDDGQPDLLGVAHSTPNIGLNSQNTSTACAYYAQSHSVPIWTNSLSAGPSFNHAAASSAPVHSVPLPPRETRARKLCQAKQQTDKDATPRVSSEAMDPREISQKPSASDMVSGLVENANAGNRGLSSSLGPHEQPTQTQNGQRSVSGLAFGANITNIEIQDGEHTEKVGKATRKFTPIGVQGIVGDSIQGGPLI